MTRSTPLLHTYQQLVSRTHLFQAPGLFFVEKYEAPKGLPQRPIQNRYCMIQAAATCLLIPESLGATYKAIWSVDEAGVEYLTIKTAGVKSTWPGEKEVYRHPD